MLYREVLCISGSGETEIRRYHWVAVDQVRGKKESHAERRERPIIVRRV